MSQKINFRVTYKIDGENHVMKMEYDTKDIEKTLTRRLTTAFPNATSIAIVQDTPEATAAAAPSSPRGAK